MNGSETFRPDPDILLRQIRDSETEGRRGKLKIFFGMCAGVGKTYAMLEEAHNMLSKGKDVVIGYVETHKRAETEALTKGLPIIPRKILEYRNTTLEEMDLDAILPRKPAIVLVDELAHTNAPGSRHLKRYQDVTELLDNGIDVYTTVNVQHLESRADTVGQITGSITRETVPDSVFEQADEVQLIDLPPDELLKRLSEGRVYTAERSREAVQNFFQKGHLTALREMSLRLTAERVDHQLRDYMQSSRIQGPWKSGQRIIVGISSSPESVKLVRWARRMAYTMSATWIVVYIDTGRTLPKEAQDQLGKNLALARELGAEVVTTADRDLVQGLLRVAQQENATQVLIGKSVRSATLFWKKSLLDRLVADSEGLDVYVVGGREEEDKPSRFVMPELRSSVRDYFMTSAVVILAVILCLYLVQFTGYHTVALFLLFVVSILPLRFGFGPVLAAAGLSALMWDFLFIEPMYTFSVGSLEDRLMLMSYFIIATITGILTTRSRAQERAVRAREERAIALYTLTRELSEARTQREVILAAVNNVKKYFDADVIVYLGEPDGDLSREPLSESTFTVEAKEFSVAAWVYWNEKPAGKQTETLPFAEATYYPLSGPRYTLGVMGVRRRDSKKMNVETASLLENFIRQISSTLDREMLHEVTRDAVIVQESERLYKTLFNSISHELRTPLASIAGAAEGLENEQILRQEPLRRELTTTIRNAAGRLTRLVENLLNMARLESGMIRPASDWSDLGDVLHSSMRNMDDELAGRMVTVTVDPDVPLLGLDYGLMEQVVFNILHNIVEYTPQESPIVLTASLRDGMCELRIEDSGPGIPADAMQKVFEKFYRVPGSKTGGTGLGLSIAKGFVEAHKGTLKAENRPEGGTRFIIRLPLPVQQPAPAHEGTGE